jgi:hypothetical protein
MSLPDDFHSLPELRYDAQKLREHIGLVTEAQFAAMMDVSEFTTQSWRVSGKGPVFAKLGRSVFYRLKDIETWMENNLHNSTETTGPVTSRDMLASELDEALLGGNIALFGS